MRNSTFELRISWAIVAGVWLLARGTPALAAVDGEAIVAQPFGVGRITVQAPPDEAGGVNPAKPILVERNGRALYPALASPQLLNLLGQLFGERVAQTPSTVTVLFLFTGVERLELTLYCPEPISVTLTPRAGRPLQRNRMLTRWWRQYNASARQDGRNGDDPPLMETYLTCMLSRRLRLPLPLLSRLKEAKEKPEQNTWQLLLGADSLREATMRRTALGDGRSDEIADQPLPEETQWLPHSTPKAAADVSVEPIAMHVPEECFYIRFGAFSNYLWFHHLLNDHTGDVRGLLSAQGHNRDLSERIERQIALKKTVLAEIMGDQVASDVAIVGRDLYLQDGPAIGMLFEARNELLGADIRKQRAAALEKEKKHGASLRTVDVAGRDVSFLSTPDNRLRSFYAVDGAYHLVTTSEAIVRGFFQAAEGSGALGTTSEFRHARTTLPIGREDTIFVYFSPAFFRSLVSPQYQIELARRIQSVADIEMVQMAQLAARAENKPSETIEDLVSGGLLPPQFGRRPDGSKPVLSGDGPLDSLRGARGSFTPVPDVPLQAATRSEAARVAAQTAYYEGNWRRLDPLMLGVKRLPLETRGRERILVDAYLSPLDERKFGRIAQLLGPAPAERISTAPGDVITVQAALSGALLEHAIPSHQLFLGVQDKLISDDLRPAGLLKMLQLLRTAPWYLGAWPAPGFLAPLMTSVAGEPDEAGVAWLPLGYWRWQADQFFLLSSDRQLLARVAPHLHVVEDDHAAHLRVHVSDLSQTKLSRLVSAMAYGRAERASHDNVQLLQAISQQFQVAPEQALPTAEKLLDAQLVCSLGGRYELVDHSSGARFWRSTKATAASADRLPEDYSAPLLEWFRGLEFQLNKEPGRVVAHAQLDKQRKPGSTHFQLPAFDFSVFGKSKKEAPAQERKPPPRPTPPKSPE